MTPSAPASGPVCPSCGSPLQGGEPGGACLRCLGRLALGAWPEEGPGPAGRPARGSRLGDYELLDEVARGGMGVVYRARQGRLRRVVALKLLLRGDLADAEVRRRFELEAEAAAALQHPGIVTVFEVGESDGEQFIAMELIDGPGLDVALRTGPWDPQKAARCVHAVAEAVAYAHGRGVLHRDLKPSNILLDAEGRPHITDFGLARLAGGSGSVTLDGRTFGSPNYMPPEQADPLRGPATFAGDVFSLGAVLYHLLTGRPPFVADTLAGTLRQVLEADPIPPRRLVPDVPVDLETLCLKCLEKMPADRYGSAQALAEDLGRFLRGEPVAARPISGPARVWRWARRHPALATVSVGLVLALAAVAVTSSVAGVRLRKSQQETEQRAAEGRRHLVRSLVVTANRYLAESDAQRALPWLWRAWELESDPGQRRVHEARLGATLRHLPELEGVWATGRRVEGLHLSPDGARVACVDGGRQVQVWSVAGPDTNLVTIERGGSVYHAAFSPDGRRILTSGNRQSMLSDADGRRIGDPFPHDLSFANIPYRLFPQFSPDGARVLAAYTNRVAVRRAETGAVEGRTRVLPDPVTALAWFPDGARFAVGTSGRRILFFEAGSGREWRPALVAAEPVRGLELGPVPGAEPGAFRLAALVGSQRVQVWSLAPTNEPAALPVEFSHAAFTYQARFIQGGRALCTTSYEGSIRIWDAAEGRLRHVFRHDGGVYRALEFGTNGWIIAGGWDETVRLWDAGAGRPVPHPRLTHGSTVLAMDVHHPTRRVASGSWDGIVRVQRLADSLPVTVSGRGVTFPVAPGRVAAVGAGTAGALFVDPLTGRPLGPVLLHSKPVRAFSVALDRPEPWVATLTTDGQAGVWTLGDGTRRFAASDPVARDLELTPDGRCLALLRTGQPPRWFNPLESRELIPPTPLPVARAVNPSPDGRHVALLGVDGRVHVLAATNLGLVAPPFGPARGAQSVFWSPDGGTLAIASGAPGFLDNADQSVRLWEVSGRRDPGLEFGHRDDIRSVAFSSDGRWLATGGDDYLAKVWDRRTGLPVTPPLRHLTWVVAMAFSADGRLLATGSIDGILRLWEVPGGEPVGPAVALPTADLRSLAFAPAGDAVQVACAERHYRWDLGLPGNVRANLAAEVTLRSGMRLDDQGGLRPLTGPELTNLWHRVRPAGR